MDLKLFIIFGVFLLADARTQRQNYKNPRRIKTMKTASSINRGIIIVEDPGSFTTPVPVTTYRPRFSGSYIRTSSSGNQLPGNDESSVNYEPEQYQNYHSSEVRPAWEASKFEKDPSGINYLPEANFVQPERVNSLKNVESPIFSSIPQSEVVNPEYGPVFSKSGYTIVSNASPINSVTVKPNDYVSTIYGRNSLSPRGFSNFNRVAQKPKKIAYSPANEVAHVRYSAGNGQVYYSW